MKKVVLKTSLDHDVTIYVYDEVKEAKAVVQIVHGASEHLTRYEEFIKFLNSKGYICVGGDILGHGESTHSEADFIYFEVDEAYESIVMVKDYALKEYGKYPLYLLGHSMGSFIARKLIIDYKDDYKKAIISGTTTMSPLITGAAKVLGSATRVLRGKYGMSPLLAELGLNGLPKKMKKNGLLKDDEMWITHDEKIAKYYKESPICGENFTVAAYQGMFSWIDFVSKKSNLKKGNFDMPILFIAGKHDPLSNFGKDILVTEDLYKELGYKDISIKLYDNMRHEVLNEIDRKTVYNDCIDFFNK